MIAPMNALALATELPCAKKPVHNESIDDKDNPKQRLPQPHRGVFVVTADGAGFGVNVVVFVICEE